MWGGGWKAALRVRVLALRECCRRTSPGGTVFPLPPALPSEAHNTLEEVINTLRYSGFSPGYLKPLGRSIHLNI